MSLAEITGFVLVGEMLMLGVATTVVVGRTGLMRAREQFRDRLFEVYPHIGLLLGVLVVNKVAREFGPELSWIIGWNITSRIYAIEGNFVGTVQSVARPELTTYFSFMYIYGYVFILVFPFVAYFALADSKPLKKAAVAFAVNYGLGLVCYILFISYGPRNLIPDVVHPLLYSTYPESQILTGQVNANTNVFPSLHTSLSVSSALLAYQTRDSYPRWTLIAIPMAASIIVATMYLGIHWATDVCAGSVLGVGSVLIADRYVSDDSPE
ncbi:phosphoesterase PA-phosphatase related protein [Haladaptatus paucihalophilus DX253]|uniref:PAP2 superfamily protein n=1 Tax=Haladaptatus paucihalophilus DX253 TaxID=797209 RepID=E7QW65_HALPU|nr:phosphatase PAP2 family protein [Haladaptatus paucihalophilus]EFW91199.1 phosphoesterase PA-phosphatase related protein [Haladaptatus paucihalophilus DX253]SHL65098.1 PAP2 superfamily protein [Haladaptatus paucihalophilus DX253]